MERKVLKTTFMKRIAMKFKFFSILNRDRSYDIKDCAESKKPDTLAENGKASESSFKRRHVVALVGFAVFLVSNVHKMNMAVSIVAMVNYSSSETNRSIAPQSCHELLYDQQENNTWNVTKTGMCPPAIMVLIANWFPTLERGSFSSLIFSGYGAGALAGSLISGYLCDIPSAGWPAVFYSCGAGGLVLALVIAIIIYENPSVHPNIHKNELKYILDNQEAKLDRKRPDIPWRSILRSVPLYALMIAKFGTNWACTYFLTLHPTFLGTILHFSISQNGLFTAIPFILQTAFTLIASAASKIMDKNGRVSIDKTRKFWNSIACLGFSACLLGIYFAGCNRTLVVILSLVAMGCVGFSFAGCLIASTDMSPVFAGTLTGITSTVGTSASFIFPVIVGFLTDGKQTLEQWKKIFCLTIGIVMISGIVFCCFGSAKVQDWNYIEEKKAKSDKRQISPTYCETQS